MKYFDDFFHVLAIAADNAFIRCVDDQKIRTLDTLQCPANFFGGSIDDDDMPIDRLVALELPRLSGRVAGAGQIGLKE